MLCTPGTPPCLVWGGASGTWQATSVWHRFFFLGVLVVAQPRALRGVVLNVGCSGVQVPLLFDHNNGHITPTVIQGLLELIKGEMASVDVGQDSAAHVLYRSTLAFIRSRSRSRGHRWLTSMRLFKLKHSDIRRICL